jgi:hypothetical protein
VQKFAGDADENENMHGDGRGRSRVLPVAICVLTGRDDARQAGWGDGSAVFVSKCPYTTVWLNEDPMVRTFMLAAIL